MDIGIGIILIIMFFSALIEIGRIISSFLHIDLALFFCIFNFLLVVYEVLAPNKYKITKLKKELQEIVSLIIVSIFLIFIEYFVNIIKDYFWLFKIMGYFILIILVINFSKYLVKKFKK